MHELEEDLGLSTRALKPDSLDPDSRFVFTVVSHELPMTRILLQLHFWTGSYARSAARIRIEPMWKQSILWIWILELHRIRIHNSCVESPIIN